MAAKKNPDRDQPLGPADENEWKWKETNRGPERGKSEQKWADVFGFRAVSRHRGSIAGCGWNAAEEMERPKMIFDTLRAARFVRFTVMVVGSDTASVARDGRRPPSSVTQSSCTFEVCFSFLFGVSGPWGDGSDSGGSLLCVLRRCVKKCTHSPPPPIKRPCLVWSASSSAIAGANLIRARPCFVSSAVGFVKNWRKCVKHRGDGEGMELVAGALNLIFHSVRTVLEDGLLYAVW